MWRGADPNLPGYHSDLEDNVWYSGDEMEYERSIAENTKIVTGQQGEAKKDTEEKIIEDVDFKIDEVDGTVRLYPTAAQLDNTPNLIHFAVSKGADAHGLFKIIYPEGCLPKLQGRATQEFPATAYEVSRVPQKDGFWGLKGVESKGYFPNPLIVDDDVNDKSGTAEQALERFVSLLEQTVANAEEGETPTSKQTKKQQLAQAGKRMLKAVRYRVDIAAWTPEQRAAAGLPADKSPIHPMPFDMLERTRAIVPGIHTPYVYESAGSGFGAPFAFHVEDSLLLSLNYLYCGRKIWIFVCGQNRALLEKKLGRTKVRCSQFMRHRGQFVTPQTLAEMEVPFTVVDQRAGELVMTLPEAYHEGFSVGYTLAEAKNYAPPGWTGNRPVKTRRTGRTVKSRRASAAAPSTSASHEEKQSENIVYGDYQPCSARCDRMSAGAQGLDRQLLELLPPGATQADRQDLCEDEVLREKFAEDLALESKPERGKRRRDEVEGSSKVDLEHKQEEGRPTRRLRPSKRY